jgi:hypothetical protein
MSSRRLKGVVISNSVTSGFSLESEVWGQVYTLDNKIVKARLKGTVLFN